MRWPSGVVATLFVILPLISIGHAQNVVPLKTPTKDFAIKVDVDLTMVNATVSDDRNRRVSGLEAKHFQIWEDKIEQQIEYFSAEEMPSSVGVIFDVSRSMGDKLSTARDAIAKFLRAGTSEDEYFLVEFNNRPRLAQGLTTDISKLQDSLVFTSAEGMTAMYDAVYLGLEQMKNSNNPKKALLLITDGEDNNSRYHAADIKEFVKEQDVQIFAIGISSNFRTAIDGGHVMLEELAEISGGRAFFPASVRELEDICAKIAAELKNQYVLGYRSTNQSKDGKLRKIRVKVNPPAGMSHLAIHARSGYYAPFLQTAR